VGLSRLTNGFPFDNPEKSAPSKVKLMKSEIYNLEPLPVVNVNEWSHQAPTTYEFQTVHKRRMRIGSWLSHQVISLAGLRRKMYRCRCISLLELDVTSRFLLFRGKTVLTPSQMACHELQKFVNSRQHGCIIQLLWGSWNGISRIEMLPRMLIYDSTLPLTGWPRLISCKLWQTALIEKIS